MLRSHNKARTVDSPEPGMRYKPKPNIVNNYTASNTET